MADAVGILALQGDFARHAEALRAHGLRVREIRSRSQLTGLGGVVLPGGESTTMLRLLAVERMYDPLRQLLGSGIPVLATCGGLILLADEVIEPPQKCMRLLPVAVVRNGYGRQIHSGTFQLDSGFFPPGTSGVFIRAPRIVRVGDAEVLARWQGDPVLVRKGPILGSCFHPELERGHPLTRHFADLVRGKLPNPTVT